MTCTACVCLLCRGLHLGDERHYLFDYPPVEDICRRHSRLFDDSRRTMRLFMWHPDQKGTASCLLQIIDEIDELLDYILRCVPCRLRGQKSNFPSLPFPSLPFWYFPSLPFLVL